MRYIRLLSAVLIKDLIYQWRYKVNTIVGILFLTFVCFGIIFGMESFSEGGLDSSEKAGFIGGYVLWLVMMTNYQTITRTITSESTLGTFEQLYINTSSIRTFLFLKCFSAFLTGLIVLYAIIFLILGFSGLGANISIIAMLPVILVGIPALWAISLGIGSLALMFKQIEAVSSVVSMIVIASIPVIVQKSHVASLLLPFGLANKLAQDIFAGESRLLDVTGEDIALILANDVAYLLIGLVLFGISERYAKKFGKLGHH